MWQQIRPCLFLSVAADPSLPLFQYGSRSVPASVSVWQQIRPCLCFSMAADPSLPLFQYGSRSVPASVSVWQQICPCFCLTAAVDPSLPLFQCGSRSISLSQYGSRSVPASICFSVAADPSLPRSVSVWQQIRPWPLRRKNCVNTFARVSCRAPLDKYYALWDCMMRTAVDSSRGIILIRHRSCLLRAIKAINKRYKI